MNFKKLISDIFYERTRMLLAIFAIAWGTFAITSALAVGDGLRSAFAKIIASVGSNFITVSGGATTKKFNGTRQGMAIKLTQDDYAAISSLPNVTNVAAQYNFFAKLYTDGRIVFTDTRAVWPSFADIRAITVEPKGRFINLADIEQRTRVVVLGVTAARQLFPNPDDRKPGKIVLVNNYPFVVIGFARKKPHFITAALREEDASWIPYSTYQLLVNPKFIDRISVTYEDLSKLPQLKIAIRRVVAFNHHVSANDQYIVYYEDFAAIQKRINTFVVGMQAFLGIIGILILAIAALGVANVMYASVRHTTAEIGLRKALGAKKWQIAGKYITESLVITIIGGVIGFLITLILIHGVKSIPLPEKLVAIIGQPKPVMSFFVLSVVILLLGLVGFLAGLVPGLKAMKIDPARALIYE